MFPALMQTSRCVCVCVCVCHRFSEHDHEVLNVTFSQDERLLLTVGSEK